MQIDKKETHAIAAAVPADATTTVDIILESLDKFFITPSLSNMIGVLQALQTHRKSLSDDGDQNGKTYLSRVIYSPTNDHMTSQ
jgi:hypothetical protein